jgi:hypothetical protein
MKNLRQNAQRLSFMVIFLGSGYKRSQSQPKERTTRGDSKKNGAEHLESPSPAPSIHTRFRDIADHADTRKAAEQLRRERDELLARSIFFLSSPL